MSSIVTRNFLIMVVYKFFKYFFGEFPIFSKKALQNWIIFRWDGSNPPWIYTLRWEIEPMKKNWESCGRKLNFDTTKTNPEQNPVYPSSIETRACLSIQLKRMVYFVLSYYTLLERYSNILQTLVNINFPLISTSSMSHLRNNIKSSCCEMNKKYLLWLHINTCNAWWHFTSSTKEDENGKRMKIFFLFVSSESGTYQKYLIFVPFDVTFHYYATLKNNFCD